MTDEEKKAFAEITSTPRVKREFWLWNYFYVILPLLLFVISIIAIIIKNNYSFSQNFINILFNGNIAIISLNISIAGLYALFNYDSQVEKNIEDIFKIDIKFLRKKLWAKIIIITIMSAIMYFIQTIFNPFHGASRIIIGSITLGTLVLSYIFSKRLLVFQGDFLNDFGDNDMNFTDENSLKEYF